MPGADATRDGSRRRRPRRAPRDAATEPPRPSARWWWPLVLVVATTLVVYANALPNAFVWDDVLLIVANPAIKHLDAIPRLFVSDLFPNGTSSGYYRPLQALTYAIDYRVFGPFPSGFRLGNVLLHASAAVLLHRVALRLTGSAVVALAAALLFAVHPLHVEAVTYISGRSDPLSAVFVLLAILGFLRGGRAAYVGSLAAFFAALLAREAALVLPCVLFALDRLAPARTPLPLRAYVPYAAVIAAYLALRAVSVGAGATPATAAVPLALRLLTTAEVVWRYLGLVVVPRGLHMERTLAPVATPIDPVAWLAVAALAAVAVTAWRFRRTAPPVALGVAWFLVALVPVANVVPLATFMAEHWLYVPLMGLALVAGHGVEGLAGVAGRRAAWTVLALAVVALGALTMRRNLDWRDGRTLYASLLPLAPESLRVRINLAESLQSAGEIAEARALYEEVAREHPNDPLAADAFNNLGNIERGAKETEAALAAFERALALRPAHVGARNGRALALQELGRVDEAEQELVAALALAPDVATTHSNLGNLYFRRDEVDRARDEYAIAIRLDPGHADAHNNLGSAYYRLGDRTRAVAEFREALRLNPKSADAAHNLSAALGTSP